MILSVYLIASAIIFGVGIFGIMLQHNNFLWLFFYLELILLAVGSNFVVYAKLWNDLNGHIFVLFMLIMTALEFGVGLAILLKFYKTTNNLLIAEKHSS